MTMINLQKICRVLEQHRCKEHNQKPTATISGQSIKLTCCCDQFQKELETKISNEGLRQINKKIDDIFKSIG